MDTQKTTKTKQNKIAVALYLLENLEQATKSREYRYADYNAYSSKYYAAATEEDKASAKSSKDYYQKRHDESVAAHNQLVDLIKNSLS